MVEVKILPELTCRKCEVKNPFVYLSPVVVKNKGSCICIPCAKKRNWLDGDDNLKPNTEL